MKHHNGERTEMDSDGTNKHIMNKDYILIVCALEVETQGQLDDWNVLYTGVGKVNATYHMPNVIVTGKLLIYNLYS